MAPTRRPPSKKATKEAAEVLRRFIEAVEAGELLAPAPQDKAVVRRLEGALAALETVAGRSRGQERGPKAS